MRNRLNTTVMTRELELEIRKEKQRLESFTPEQRNRLNELGEKLAEIVGFGAVLEKGYRLNQEEIVVIAEYSSLLGARKEYVTKILSNAGRPFTLNDPAFLSECNLCKSLRNYCCC